MPFFAEETIAAVRSIPLYEIVRPVVDLSRSGKNWRGLSPFTNEKTPSFYVLTDRNFFKCHSSQLAGDGIRFVQETEKLTFPEAVESLAERFNIPIRYAEGKGPDPEARSMRQALLDIHEYACDYYHRAFMAEHPESEEIRRYWVADRGFTMQLAEEFRIGFSPVHSRKLLGLLQTKGFSLSAIAKSGLFNPGRNMKDLDSWYFHFRGRLMIPICDPQGHVVAFTARQLEITPKDQASWKAKYINSPETDIFKKSKLLFNMNRAKDGYRESDRIVMVEGQLDAMRCWDVGIEEAVAPQGTSVTEEQLKLIKRYTPRLDVLLDSDSAGSKAAFRLLPMAYKEGLEVHVTRLPEGQDPDDYLRQHGKAGLQQLEKESGITFAGKSLLPGPNPSPEERSRALNSLFEILSACPSAVVREGYFNEAVEATGVSERAAREDFQRFRRSRPAAPQPRKPAVKRISQTKSSETLTNLEGDLIWAVLKNVEWVDSLAQVVDHQWIRNHTIEGKVLSRILDQATVDHIEGTEGIYFLLESDEERDCFSRYNVDDRSDLEMESFVNQTIEALAKRYCREQVDAITEQINKIEYTESTSTEIRRLMEKRSEWNRLLRTGPFPTISPPEEPQGI